MAMAAAAPWRARHSRLHPAPYKGASTLDTTCPSCPALLCPCLSVPPLPELPRTSSPPVACRIRRLCLPSARTGTAWSSATSSRIKSTASRRLASLEHPVTWAEQQDASHCRRWNPATSLRLRFREHSYVFPLTSSLHFASYPSFPSQVAQAIETTSTSHAPLYARIRGRRKPLLFAYSPL
jgi:hypothetical protein